MDKIDEIKSQGFVQIDTVLLPRIVIMSKEQRDWLISEIERKNEALKKYGLHKEGCDIECYYEEPIYSDKCTCGLSQALKEKK